MASKRFTLNESDLQKWVISALEWVAPLGLIYFGQVAVYIADGFSFADFIPNNALQGALALYVVNQLYGLSKRFASGK
jgi:hypothetical protein